MNERLTFWTHRTGDVETWINMRIYVCNRVKYIQCVGERKERDFLTSSISIKEKVQKK